MISDQHSKEWTFEEIQPEINGIRLDTYFSGTAVLENDPGYSFVVSSITLDGTTLEPFPKPRRVSRDRIAAKLTLKRPASDDTSIPAQLFRLLADTIENDQDAQDAWADETLMAAE